MKVFYLSKIEYLILVEMTPYIDIFNLGKKEFNEICSGKWQPVYQNSPLNKRGFLMERFDECTVGFNGLLMSNELLKTIKGVNVIFENLCTFNFLPN